MLRVNFYKEIELERQYAFLRFLIRADLMVENLWRSDASGIPCYTYHGGPER
jgi:hypothetical protein